MLILNSSFVSFFSLYKNPQRLLRNFLAGAVGIEPTTKVLETSVIPFHHAPVARVAEV